MNQRQWLFIALAYLLDIMISHWLPSSFGHMGLYFNTYLALFVTSYFALDFSLKKIMITMLGLTFFKQLSIFGLNYITLYTYLLLGFIFNGLKKRLNSTRFELFMTMMLMAISYEIIHYILLKIFRLTDLTLATIFFKQWIGSLVVALIESVCLIILIHYLNSYAKRKQLKQLNQDRLYSMKGL